MMSKSAFEQKLQQYADLIIRVGLNLQAGQRLIILASPLEVAPLVRWVTRQAYQRGSRLVTVLWIDEQLNRIRHQYAPRNSFEEFPAWTLKGMAQVMQEGDAYLQIYGSDPELLKDQDPELVATATRALWQSYKPVLGLQDKNTVQWLVVYPVTAGWAARVFPDRPAQEAEDRLWEAVIKACRLDQADPVAFWQRHLVQLDERKEYLTAKQYTGLHFTGPGTDLTVGLPGGHLWQGGESRTQSGVPFVANLPTEEVFTLPHKYRTQGVVTATRPLPYGGNLIENFSLTFSEGKVVNFSASKGEEILRKLLETDENARRLGEVALVPHQSPISQSGLIFLSPLYDENASNHLALGGGYRFALENGDTMSDEEFEQAGGNDSLVHVDFMFGSGEMNVDGLKADGTAEPVMHAGEWAFDV